MIEKYDSDKYYFEGDIVDVYGTICKVHEFWESNCQECCFKDKEDEICQFMYCVTLHEGSFIEKAYINFEELSEIEVLILKGSD